MSISKILSSDLKKKTTEEEFDNNLRPSRLADYIGQTQVKRNLKVLLQAARLRNQVPDHVLLYGPPGLGKTTLAHIIAQELQVPITTTSGPALARVGDIVALLTNLQNRSILFIDEIHRLPKSVEEILYLAMEDRVLDITIGKGTGAKTLRLDLPTFTIIGATTRIGALSNPFRDRFGVSFRLEFYDDLEIKDILIRSSRVLGISVEEAALNFLASRSRMTPRIANRLLKRVVDLALVSQKNTIDARLAAETLDLLAIDQYGLDSVDRRLLEAIIISYQGGPVGLRNLSAVLAEDTETIEEVIEPFLLRSGLLQRTTRGRVATEKAFQICGQLARYQNTLARYQNTLID